MSAGCGACACPWPARSQGFTRQAWYRPGQGTLEAYLRHLFLWGPEVKVEIGDPKPSTVPGLSEVTVRASAALPGRAGLLRFRDGKKIIQGVVYDIDDNPFRPELSKLGSVSGPSLGTPGAPVVLVLFTDFQCPYCREEAKMLRENLVSTFPKEVRLYLKEFPLEQIHPWAKPAAIAGRCVFQQNPAAFWQYHDWVFEQQAQITPENLRAKVMDFRPRQADRHSATGPVPGHQGDGGRGEQLHRRRPERWRSTQRRPCSSTAAACRPRSTGRNCETIIGNEIEYQKTAKNAGDKPCCEVTLPSPLVEVAGTA